MRLLPCTAGDPCGDAAAHFELPVNAGSVTGGFTGSFTGGFTGGAHLLAIVDGLGHGPEAALAARAAVRLLDSQRAAPLPELMARLDRELMATRGAAVGLARIDGSRLLYAGVGNTRALRWRGGRLLRLSSQYGIVGGGLPAGVQVTEVDLAAGDWLLLFSDGIDEMVQLAQQLPEWERDPGLLCEHLLARWRDPRDDAGVLACQWRGG